MEQIINRPEPVGITAGAIPLTFTGGTVAVRPLTIAENRAWKQSLAEALSGSIDRVVMTGNSDWESAVNAFSGLTEKQIDLILGYDVDRSIQGGREWIETHATDRDVHDAFKALCRVSFPLLDDLWNNPTVLLQVMAELRARAAPSGSGSSTNLPSTNGAPVRSRTSKRRSPTNSSSSS